MNYDPNMTLSGRMAKQTVRLTFQQWEYKVEMVEHVGGNCTGMTVIDCAIGNAYASLSNDRGVPYIILTDAGGNTLQCHDDEDKGEDWLKDMLVKAEIIAIEASA